MDHVELELKLRLADRTLMDKLIGDPLFLGGDLATPPETTWLESTYYDTADRRLKAQRYTFRIRRAGAALIATIKGKGSESGGLHRRDEWNRAIQEEVPSLEPFADLPIFGELQEILAGELLVPLLRTAFKRTAVVCTTEDGSSFELAADLGEITVGTERAEICELEFELKSGAVIHLFEAAEALAVHYPLIPESKSKYHRGLELAGLAAAVDDEAQAPAQGANYAALVRQQTTVINKRLSEFAQCPEAPESAHQLRVSVRQLRSVLYMLRPLFQAGEYQKIQSELRDMARCFTRLRELDVLLESWIKYTAAQPGLAEGAEAFITWMTAERARELVLITALVREGAFTPVLMGLGALAEALGAQCYHNEDGSLTQAIHRRLRKKLRQLGKSVKGIALGDTPAVHRLRIQCKRLNYAVEFLGSGMKKVPKKQQTLKALQKLLGELCDHYVDEQLVLEFSDKPEASVLQFKLGAYVGYLTARAESLAARLSKKYQ